MNQPEDFPERVEQFILAANRHQLKMILVGSGAVNFYGYRRHSADIDFWIELSDENLEKCLDVLIELGYDLKELPKKVKSGRQNISIKISPVFELELITNFNPGKTFAEAFADSELVKNENLEYRVLGFNDLIQSKIVSDRIKDKLDVEELQRIKKKGEK